jgi:hypothetical protein
MWQQYRKTLVPMQIMIVAFAFAAIFLTHGNVMGCLWVLGVMEAGAVAGAWYGVRLRGRIQARANALPLRR